MIAVLRTLEGPIAPMICASDESELAHEPSCDRTARCTVNFLWIRIRDAISTTLEGMSLADLVPERLAPLASEPIIIERRAGAVPDPALV